MNPSFLEGFSIRPQNSPCQIHIISNKNAANVIAIVGIFRYPDK